MSNIYTDQAGAFADLNETLSQVAHRQFLGVGDFELHTSTPARLATGQGLVWSFGTGSDMRVSAALDRPPPWFLGTTRVTVNYAGALAHATQVIGFSFRLTWHQLNESISASADTALVTQTLAPHPTVAVARQQAVFYPNLSVHGGHTDGSLVVSRLTAGNTYTAGLYLSSVVVEYLSTLET